MISKKIGQFLNGLYKYIIMKYLYQSLLNFLIIFSKLPVFNNNFSEHLLHKIILNTSFITLVASNKQ